jgi:hypothetical protein
MSKVWGTLFAAVIFLGILRDPAQADSEKIGAVMQFFGQCARYDDTKEDDHYCETHVDNIRYVDGFDSFQFRTPPKSSIEQDREITEFIGSHWGNNKSGHGAENLSDNMTFMVINQVVFSNIFRKVRDVKPYKGQCVLEFNTAESRDAASINKIFCEYSDGKESHGLSLDKITKLEPMIIQDFMKYGK